MTDVINSQEISMLSLPPNPFAAQLFNQLLDTELRPRYFKNLDFAEPVGDPGWFGPKSPVWYVHSNMPVLMFGLFCAAYMEQLDPSIIWMGHDHSRIVKRVDGIPVGVDGEGVKVRLAHSLSFFIATAYGSTPTAERAARTVRSMHHTVKGTRPDGLAYDADDPEWLRWNYATVVWGIAAAHERYHPRPLRGEALDGYYREFVRVGEALGGTDLPATKTEVLAYLQGAVPRLALSPALAARTGPNVARGRPLSRKRLGWFLDWASRDMLPDWGRQLVLYRRPDVATLLARRSTLWTLLNGVALSAGPLRELRQANDRVSTTLSG